jgi:hypothetical protein
MGTDSAEHGCGSCSVEGIGCAPKRASGGHDIVEQKNR